MPISITSNLSSINAQRNISRTDEVMSRSLNRLSSGQRVASAADDAASLAIGTGLRTEVASLRAAALNVSQGSSMLQIADGAFNQITDIMTRMKSLANQAASGQYSAVERGFINDEYQQLLLEVDRIGAETEFNGVFLLGGAGSVQVNTQGANVDSDSGFAGFEFNGSLVNPGNAFTVTYNSTTNIMTMTNTTTSLVQTMFVNAPTPGNTIAYNFGQLGVKITLSSAFNDTVDMGLPIPAAAETFNVAATATATAAVLDFQVGTGTASADRITVTLPIGNTNAFSLAGTNMLTVANAQTASNAVETAVITINTARSRIGAALSRLDVAASNLAASIENTESARSTLLDTDVSTEMSEFVAKQALMQAGVSILAQANQNPQRLLRLLE